jgi:hypothetical protein
VTHHTQTANLSQALLGFLHDTRQGECTDLGTMMQAELAPITEQPVLAYRHELDDMDAGGPASDFGSDVAGGPARRTGRTVQRPDQDAVVKALLEMVGAGVIERRNHPNGAFTQWRVPPRP